MTIVCGTDLSAAASRAAHAAAAVAGRLGVPLKLVHVVDDLGAEITHSELGQAAFADVRERLRSDAGELRRQFAVEVEPVVVPGGTERQLVAVAVREHATLLVVAAVGRTQRHRWLLGSVAEHVARRSPVPVLVVRDHRPIIAWARGERPLEVMVGVERSANSKRALDWAAGLRRIAPCDLAIVELISPASEHARLGIPAQSRRRELDPELVRAEVAELRAWVGRVPGEGKTTFVVDDIGDAVDWQLSQRAEATDLLVVGTHQRSRIKRLWHGSVSRGVLKHASTNVACVPDRGELAWIEPSPTVGSVLVATDLSPAGNQAVGIAYGIVRPGGVLHVLHVVGRDSDRAAAEQALRELVLVDRGEVVRTEIEIIESSDVATAIAEAASRFGVDFVCMATHGRAMQSNAAVGSQVQRVLAQVRKPLVLVPPNRTS